MVRFGYCLIGIVFDVCQSAKTLHHGCIYFLSYEYIITELTKKLVDRIIHNMDFRLGNLRGKGEVTTETSGDVQLQAPEFVLSLD